MKKLTIVCLLAVFGIYGCGKGGGGNVPPPTPPPVPNFTVSSWSVNGVGGQTTYVNVNRSPAIRFKFSTAINRGTVPSSIVLKDNGGGNINYTPIYENGDSVVLIQPASPLNFLSKYTASVTAQLKSAAGGNLTAAGNLSLLTLIDSSRKFPTISDAALLDKVQQQTFKYFWDFGHPVSGLARERSNGDNEVVTSGGSGFGIMAIVAAVDRGFITRAQALTRLQTMVSFLKNTTEKYHGAFPHWLNGTDGKTIPFSANDDGADLVETSYLMQGLLCARQYFNQAAAAELTLRNDINSLWNGVEWDWFRQNAQNTLYWHWSAKNANGWVMNQQIRGWNECLITYVLAASSTTHSIPKIVYDNGWASNGGMKNGKNFYGYTLPLGPDFGGPLFFSHYSFLGINPTGLSDTYANYATQTKNHSLINYSYCVQNPAQHFGYSDSVWGLTASDIKNSYNASSPTSDVGVIAPTAAISSIPYTPTQSMAALKFYYYVLGDKLWKDYGFIDAFSLQDPWFAESFLAIDQGPIMIMIENYRSGLLWNLFTGCPEIETGMQTLGFTAPYL